ncbi:hypothetical protein BV898_15807 [Hypsibius exemplaris]|uniref:OTU domain-containing protein n=1 Tax=Hypsibius exemplaris TaxID=2072580 RepID=A0A9X6RKX6_HYPEX|nr:hypothetical protein BV898_15807 [Hypsibius exemplaris]
MGICLAVLAAIHLLPLPSSVDARSSVIKNAEYVSTVSEVLRGYADVLDNIRRKVQESAAYFNIITQKQQIDRAALEGMVLWMQKCHLPLTTLGDGHCLFRALSWTLFGHQDGHLRLRLLSISVIAEHDAYFFTYRRLLSMKEDFSLPEMIHHTSNSSPTFDNGWGNCVQHQVYCTRRAAKNLRTLARAAHESECPHKAFYPAEKYQNSNRRSLCIMLLGERQFAHYVGILPRHWSLRESPEFAVTRRYDVSVGSRLDWGYVSSDDDDNGFPRASKKRTVSHLSTPVRNPTKRTATLKRTPVQDFGEGKRSMSPTEASPNPKKKCALLSAGKEGDQTLLFDFSNEEESRVLVDYPCQQLELATMNLLSQDAAGDESDIELGNPVGRRHRIIVDYDDWDEQFEEEEPFKPSKNLPEQSILVIKPFIELPPACYDLEEPTLSPDFNLSDITAELENAPLPDCDAD